MVIDRFPFDPSQTLIGLVHNEMYFEIELRYVCLTDFAAIVVKPDEFAGGWVLSRHVPYFAYATLRGFAYGGQITWWIMDEIRWQIENGRIDMNFDPCKLKPWFA